MDCAVHGNLQARILEWVAFPFSRGSSQPRDRTQVSYIVGGFSTDWTTREVGSLSLIQRIFLTQESNQGLLHCRRFLVQLSYRRFSHWCELNKAFNLIHKLKATNLFVTKWDLAAAYPPARSANKAKYSCDALGWMAWNTCVFAQWSFLEKGSIRGWH